MSGRKKARDQRGLQKERQRLFAFLDVNSKHVGDMIDIYSLCLTTILFVYTLEYTQINRATHFSLAASPNQAGGISI